MKPSLEAMDEMEELVLKTAPLQYKRQNMRAAEEGEVVMKGVFKAYLNFDGKKNVEQDVPPPKLMKKTRDEKKTYPAKLSHKTQVLHLTPVEGQCEPLPGGEKGWRIRAKLSYNEKETENAKQWLLDHYASFYDGKYQGSFPVGEYVNEEGELAEYKWIKVHERSIVTMKTADAQETVFRRHVDGKESNPYVVGPLTAMTYYKVTAEQFVTLRKESDESDAALVPVGYNSFVCKGVQLSEDHDALLPTTERLHQLENKDVHNMIPMDRLRAGDPLPDTAYFWVCHKYQSPQPCPTGISVFKLKADDLSEFIGTYSEKTVVRHPMRFTLFQWKGDPGTQREMYSVKTTIPRESELWKQYGITDPQHYANILLANYTLPCHVYADLWKKQVLEAETNAPDMLNNKPELVQMRGFYTYGIKSLFVDYIEYWKRGMAHRISKDRVEREFKRFTTVNQDTEEKEIHLKPVAEAKSNPLNGERPANAPVFALGNGQVEDPQARKAKPLYHAYDEDLCPRLEDSEFFVLTSYALNHDEVQLVQDPKRGDEMLDKLIEEHKVFYWMFGIRKKYLSPKVAAPVPVPPPNTPSKAVAKRDDGEAELSNLEPETPATKKKKTATNKKK